MSLLSLFALLDLPTIFGGHTYDTGSSPPRESVGDDGETGIGTPYVVAVLLLALVTVGLLAWLSPSKARAKLKPAAPAALMAVIIVAPLALWAGSSGGDEKSLLVERATGVTGAPEFIVYLGEDDLNTLDTTNGKRAVRVECLGRDGKVVLDARQRWPFVNEPGYDYPHVHQAASPEQLQRAERCRLRGTRVRLEGDVEGPVGG